MTYRAQEIAEYFIVQGINADEPVSKLKIQKLCYYAQGLYLALYNKPLYEEQIQAWTHGPVCPELFDLYKVNPNHIIPEIENYDPDTLNQDTKDFLDEVNKVYGQFSAWKLRDMTHSEPPWMEAFEEGANNIITHEAMIKFFKTRLVS